MLLLGFKEKISSKLISLKHQKINNYYVLLSLNEERDNVIDEIKNISHIKNAYYLIGISEDSYLYTYIDSNLYDVSYGRNIENDKEVLVHKNKKDIILLNKDFIIVGTYDIFNDFLGFPDNMIITSYKNIIDRSNDAPKKDILIEVDDYTNVQETSNVLEKKYECNTIVFDSDSDILSKYTLFINIVDTVIRILLVISFILFVALGITFMHDEENDNINLRVLGYSNIIVVTSILLKVTTTFILAFLLSLILSIVIMVIFNSFFAINIMDIIDIILLLYLILFISITTLTFFYRKKRLIRE